MLHVFTTFKTYSFWNKYAIVIFVDDVWLIVQHKLQVLKKERSYKQLFIYFSFLNARFYYNYVNLLFPFDFQINSICRFLWSTI